MRTAARDLDLLAWWQPVDTSDSSAMRGGDSSTRDGSTCTSSSCTTIAAAFGHTSKATGHASLTTHHRAQTAGAYSTERKEQEQQQQDEQDHTHSSIVHCSRLSDGHSADHCRLHCLSMLMAHALCLARTRRYEEWSLPTGVSSLPFIPRVAVRPSVLHYMYLAYCLLVCLSVCQYNAHRLHMHGPFMTVMSCHVMSCHDSLGCINCI
jgi:hypothetical protein